ncbi:component of IIS longevity pathway SMK-1, putative [Babesia ovis]|uniref:Component of IIS longevity pathway SMK-1, putative n=1 Tax=Babesia ovis TaxID=5869 RepID=A0A9W5WTJ4_BABOV|nr:component of IIS longevity pathway SMK-1, putative [Babesia ovis]
MADNANQEALDAIEVELRREPRLQKAHPVNGIPASCRRVKLYEIYSTHETWIDKGTGYCHVKEPTDGSSPQIVIELEQDGSTVVVVSNILYNTNYSSQNDSIIIWQEGSEERLYRALSFQNVVGHKSFWTYISDIVDEKRIQASSKDRDVGYNNENDVDIDGDNAQANGSPNGDTQSPRVGVKYGGGYRALPTPTVQELRKLETTIDPMLAQNTLSDMIFMDLLEKRWLLDTFCIMRHCVDVDDLSTLSSIAAIMARLMLNWCGNLELMHVFVSDEIFFDLLRAFEYDAELLSQNLTLEHVKFFREHVKHHDVIVLGNPTFYRLVHSSYRIEYLKDVVLPRQLDEFSIQRLNSVIFSNTNEILNTISSDGRGFVDSLKEQLPKNYMAAMLLRELLSTARCSQGVNQPDRISLLLLIKHSQLLNELSGYLDGTAPACRNFEETLKPENERAEKDYSMLKGSLVMTHNYRPDLLGSRRHRLIDPVSLAVEIFNLCLEVFPSIVRTAVFSDAEAKGEPALLYALCDVLASNPHEGIQTQTRDIFVRLLDPKNMDLPEKDEMCSLFYDNGVLDRIVDRIFGTNVPDSQIIRIAKVHAMDLLSLCAREHRHRFKLRVQSHKLPMRVLASCLRPFDKFVAVGAMKFLHVCIKMKDMSVERHITKYHLLRPVMWILKTKVQPGKDGGSMLESVCLGILNTIDSWALDGLVDALFQDQFCNAIYTELKQAYSHCCDNFVFNNLERIYRFSRGGTAEAINKKRHIFVDPDRWFEEDDDDEDVQVKRHGGSTSSNLVDGYDEEDDDYTTDIDLSNIPLGKPIISTSIHDDDGDDGIEALQSKKKKLSGEEKAEIFDFTFKASTPSKINVFIDSCRKQPTSSGDLANDFMLDSTIKFAEPNRYYISRISFGNESRDDKVQSSIGNSDFLPESQVATTFARLTGVAENDAYQLLNGTKRIEEIPALSYCIPLKQSQRTTVDNLYYYSLSNGIYIFGLDENHEAVQYIKRGGSIKAIEYTAEINDRLCYTKGSKKRTRSQVIPSGIACIIHMPEPVSIMLPEALRSFDIIETNTKLLKEPSKLAKPDDGWIVMLMDKAKSCRQPRHKN